MKSAALFWIVSLQADSERFQRLPQSAAEDNWRKQVEGKLDCRPAQSSRRSTRLPQVDCCLIVPLERQVRIAGASHAAEMYPAPRQAATTRRGRAKPPRPSR